VADGSGIVFVNRRSASNSCAARALSTLLSNAEAKRYRRTAARSGSTCAAGTA
jgi:hypothetical protein